MVDIAVFCFIIEQLAEVAFPAVTACHRCAATTKQSRNHYQQHAKVNILPEHNNLLNYVWPDRKNKLYFPS
jgi:hypothetical protein